MQWIECAVPCEGDPEQLCYALAELGVEGMSIEDEKDFREFLENNRAYWDYVDEELEQRFAGVSRVKFWLSTEKEGRDVLAAVRAARCVTSASARSNISITRTRTGCIVISMNAARSCPVV